MIALASAALVVVIGLALPRAASAYVFVAGYDSDQLRAFDQAANGALTPAGGPVATGGRRPVGVSLTPDGTRVFASNSNFLEGGPGNTIAAYTVGAGGSLTPPPGSPFATSGRPEGTAVTPDGTRLYVANTDGDEISSYAIGADGSLAPLPGFPVAAGDVRGIAITPDGRFLYATRSANNRIAAWSIAADGTIAELPSEFEAGAGATGLAVTPDGSRLYATNVDGASVSGYAIGADGTLTPLPGSPFAAGTGPLGIAITPDGTRVYVANQQSDGVSGFAIGADGALAALPGSPYAAGDGPSGIAATPDGKRLYVSNFGSPDAAEEATVSGFDIAADGSLAAIAGSPFATGMTRADFQSVAITPNQGPVAALSATRQGDSPTVDLNGAGSADPDGSVATYAFGFGDGQTQIGPSPTATHTYAKPGDYTATLTVADNLGCFTFPIYTGQTASCNGTATAAQSAEVDLGVTGLGLAGKKRQKLGRAIKVKASADEEVTAEASGKLKLRGGGKRSLRAFKLKGQTKPVGAGGTATLKLRLPKKALKAAKGAGKAKAKISVTATDDAGNEAGAKRKVKLKA